MKEINRDKTIKTDTSIGTYKHQTWQESTKSDAYSVKEREEFLRKIKIEREKKAEIERKAEIKREEIARQEKLRQAKMKQLAERRETEKKELQKYLSKYSTKKWVHSDKGYSHMKKWCCSTTLLHEYFMEAEKAKLVHGMFPVKLYGLYERPLGFSQKVSYFKKQESSLLRTTWKSLVSERYIRYTIVYKIEDNKAWELYQENPEALRSKIMTSFTKDYHIENVTFRRGSLEVVMVVCAVLSAVAASVEAILRVKEHLKNGNSR